MYPWQHRIQLLAGLGLSEESIPLSWRAGFSFPSIKAMGAQGGSELTDPVLWPVVVLVAVPLIAGGLIVVLVTRRATNGQLSRNSWAGIRTSATMASDMAWDVGQRAGGRLTIAGGWVMVLSGLAMFVWRSLAGFLLLNGIGISLGLSLIIAGAVRGHQTAKTAIRQQIGES